MAGPTRSSAAGESRRARLGLTCLLAWPALAQPGLQTDVEAQLADAVALFQSSFAEAFFHATDPNERFDALVFPGVVSQLAEQGDFDVLFQFGDEAFEVEIDRAGGLGQGEATGPLPLPAVSRRVHDGERGGLDAGSCRACHFVGGPDGSGAMTQVALFRGDGLTLSSADARDPPHVMGLGYVSLAAEHISALLQAQRTVATELAASAGRRAVRPLVVDGVDFGEIAALPDGTVDTSGVVGVSPDLVVRPFGHKGRHATLPALADEALQVHHGLQSSSRLAEYAGDAETFLGDGPEADRDGDGIEGEATEGQAVLLASYLSMLGVPRIAPPTDPELALVWARGRRMFGEVGCERCHRARHALEETAITHSARAGGLTVRIELSEAGQPPVPAQLDFGEDEEGFLYHRTPIFPFTDLRRHAMGAGLAARDEPLPDGGGVVAGDTWLTRSLWGLADTAPYLHDGRAPTVQDAIRAHGGEAVAARDAYDALPESDRSALRVFLLSLTRAPIVLVE